MFGSVSTLLAAGRALVKPPLLARGMANKKYGVEEGHGQKSEVRKLKWQRKHLVRATGGRFRTIRGLQPDPFLTHGLVSRPDWSYHSSEAADARGAPGTLTPRQQDAVVIMREMVEDVKKALEHVNTKV